MSGDVVDYLAPVAAGALGGFLGPSASDALGLGLDAVTAEALGGGLAGALTGGLVGKGGITGALTGGLEGAAAGPLFDLGVNSIFGQGTIPGTGGAAGLFGGATTPGSTFTTNMATTPATGSGTGAASISPGFGNSAGNIGPEGAASVDLTSTTVPGLTGAAADPMSAVNAGTVGAASNTGGFNLGNFLTNNKSWLIPAAGMGIAALQGDSQTPAQSSLQSEADALSGQQGQLLSALTTGKLPAGAEAAILQGVNAAKATIRSSYASMGLSGSTMEATALAQADESAAEQRFTIAQQLATTGLSEAQISGQIYQALANQQLQDDQSLQTAIADFAAAMAGGGGNSNAYKLVPAS